MEKSDQISSEKVVLNKKSHYINPHLQKKLCLMSAVGKGSGQKVTTR